MNLFTFIIFTPSQETQSTSRGMFGSYHPCCLSNVKQQNTNTPLVRKFQGIRRSIVTPRDRKVSPSLACQYTLRGYLKRPERADEHVTWLSVKRALPSPLLPLYPRYPGIRLLVFPLRVYRRLLFTAVSYLLRFIHGVIAPAVSSLFRIRPRCRRYCDVYFYDYDFSRFFIGTIRCVKND